ncbi:interleukin-23 receptor [Antennarius striatus]|uniref:interleukin-23 receptor n=1 Tax=Antennarius striatus TaxID=241820 RepID=UPI0035B14DF0
MSPYSNVWRFVIIFISFIVNCCCAIFCGSVTTQPSSPFILGSNLTVYCNITKCQPQEWSKISLEWKDKMWLTVAQKKISSPTEIFSLLNVQTAEFTIRCVRQRGQEKDVIDGLDLHAGLPPDKPENIICETPKSSDLIDCTWEKGQETHISTVYNISVNRENETAVHLGQIQDDDKITIQRAQMDEDTKYLLVITARNHFGASQSDPVVLCVKDIVIPDTPCITLVTFGKNSAAAFLQWKTNDSAEPLRSYVRLRTENGSWEVGETTELSDGLTKVDHLKFLTNYEFQLTTCNSVSELTDNSTSKFTPWSATRKRSYCSKWSQSVLARSPRKGPSEQLDVWRTFSRQRPDELLVVTVLWKPPSPDDYSGEVEQYNILLGEDQKQNMSCSAASSQCSVQLQLPAGVQTLRVSAVTPHGTSPPTDVTLQHSGEAGPVFRVLASETDGFSVLVSWSWLRDKQWRKLGGELLQYVIEWTSVPATVLHWQKLAKDENRTSVSGLTPGVRYNISLYAVTTRGVSAPSTHLIYSKEKKPLSGPSMSVLAHEARRIWVQWEELPVFQQQGFIINYTIYLQTLDSSNMEINVTVSGSGPRQKWLECPEASLALQMTASTSEGEGPRGNRISSQPATPAVGLVVVIVFIFIIFIAVIANLMCCSCIKKRIKQTCRSRRPAWLVENLPKPGNSLAIRLLKENGNEPMFSSIDSDPPLSLITLISPEERNDMYPSIQAKMSQVGSGQPTSETALLMSDPGLLGDSQVEHVGYKPQIVMLDSREEEEMVTEEEQREMPPKKEDRYPDVFRGLLGGFLPNVEVDLSDSPFGLTLASAGSLVWPKTYETTNVPVGGFLLESALTEDNVEANCPSLYSQQGGLMTRDTADTCSSQFTDTARLTGGYFPQVAAVSSTTTCGAQT